MDTHELITSTVWDIETTIDGRCHLFFRPMGTAGKPSVNTNMVLPSQMPQHVEFILKKLQTRVEYTTVLTLFVGVKQCGQYVVWGEKEMDVVPIPIEGGQHFFWEAITMEKFNREQEVFVSMQGLLKRPIC